MAGRVYGGSKALIYDQFGNPINERSFAFGYFTNDVYATDMNQDGRFTGTPDDIYLENEEWTMTGVSGTWDFDSTDQAQAGSKSIDGTDSGNGAVFKAVRSSSLDLSNYCCLTGWIYITKKGAVDNLVFYAYDGTGDQIIGNSVDLTTYITFNTTNTWVFFRIPLSDMGIESSSIDEIRVEVEDTGTPFEFYLDTLKIQQTGNILFEVRPFPNTWLEINNIEAVIKNDAVNTVSDASMPFVSTTNILGVTISSPITFQVGQAGTILPAGTFFTPDDYLELGAHIESYGDASNTVITLNLVYPSPIVLKAERGDFLRLNISDDLSGLTKFRASYRGNVYFRT